MRHLWSPNVGSVASRCRRRTPGGRRLLPLPLGRSPNTRLPSGGNRREPFPPPRGAAHRSPGPAAANLSSPVSPRVALIASANRGTSRSRSARWECSPSTPVCRRRYELSACAEPRTGRWPGDSSLGQGGLVAGTVAKHRSPIEGKEIPRIPTPEGRLVFRGRPDEKNGRIAVVERTPPHQRVAPPWRGQTDAWRQQLYCIGALGAIPGAGGGANRPLPFPGSCIVGSDFPLPTARTREAGDPYTTERHFRHETPRRRSSDSIVPDRAPRCRLNGRCRSSRGLIRASHRRGSLPGRCLRFGAVRRWRQQVGGPAASPGSGLGTPRSAGPAARCRGGRSACRALAAHAAAHLRPQ